MHRLRAVAVISLTSSGLAGPLNPPAGPVAATHKTLTEIEPRTPIDATNTPGDADSLFRISQPGSYYVVANITGVAGKHGIEVEADGVTIDLRGFDLAGVAGSLDGVRIVPGHKGVTVRDGNLRDWDGAGVNAVGGPNADGCLYMNLRLEGNGVDAFSYALDFGGASTAINCVAAYNLGTGIRGNNGTIIAECAASGNGGDGIIGGAGTIRNCLARGNAFDGIRAGSSVITGCSATANQGAGITIHHGSVASDNTCFFNGWGFYVYGDGSRLDGNTVYQNVVGVEAAEDGNAIMRNVFRDNATTITSTPGNDVGPFESAATGTSPWGNIKL